MIDRGSFIRRCFGGIAVLPAISLKDDEPTEWRENHDLRPLPTEYEYRRQDEGQDDLWPNDKPFPCTILAGPPEYLSAADRADCGACRGNHNGVIITSDPEWFDNITVDVKGMWSEQ